MCMFETQKRTNKQTQQILKDIIQDNISGIKINTHHKQTCKNILSMSFFVTLQHLGENVLDLISLMTGKIMEWYLKAA